MAYGIGGRDAIVSPMSLALGWGLVFSTGVTLVLLPILYTLANDLRELRFTEPWADGPAYGPQPAPHLLST